MMTAEDRIAEIRTRLESAFDPYELAIQDDSHLHVGHAGARSGKGHFTVRIRAAAFDGQAPLARALSMLRWVS